ncbi:MAG: glycerophosphodiester phosphodiesterase family protein [Bauldia sp.]
MKRLVTGALTVSVLLTTFGVLSASAQNTDTIQLGPRPFFLVDNMDPGALQDTLRQCEAGPFARTTFSIGHRGAPLQFPEHTEEGYTAAARMGAGILECDVTFTEDRQLVCRHSQCDLHTTTNILAIPELAARCSQPFQPADPATGRPASAMCCTSDITLAEFQMLTGKMDTFNPNATTVEEYMGGTATFRTDLYANEGGTLMTHAQSIALFDQLGVDFTPELKEPMVEMPFQGDYTQEMYAQQLIDEYIAAGIDPSRVFPQSFYYPDVVYWAENAGDFGLQGVYLDDRYERPGYEGFDPMNAETWSPTFEEMVADGVRIVAPPIPILLTLDEAGEIVPSAYAIAAKEAGLEIITWTLERSGPLNVGGGGFYYASIADAINNDGDMFTVLDVLAQDVGVLGVFSDWAATTTYYANCMGLGIVE